MNWKEFNICFGFNGTAWRCLKKKHLSREISMNDDDIQTFGDLSANEIILGVSLKYINEEYISSEEFPRCISTGIIIDPIDGTSNFHRNLPMYTHAVSYIKDKILQFFSVYIPSENLLLYGNRSSIYCNNHLLRPKHTFAEKKSMIVSLMYNTHYSPDQKEICLKFFEAFMKNGINIRISGSPSYDIASAVLGRIDAFINIKPHQFDALPLCQIMLTMHEKTCLTLKKKGTQEQILIGGDLETVSLIRDFLLDYI